MPIIYEVMESSVTATRSVYLSYTSKISGQSIKRVRFSGEKSEAASQPVTFVFSRIRDEWKSLES
jgi:hypothetical protein